MTSLTETKKAPRGISFPEYIKVIAAGATFRMRLMSVKAVLANEAVISALGVPKKVALGLEGEYCCTTKDKNRVYFSIIRVTEDSALVGSFASAMNRNTESYTAIGIDENEWLLQFQ